MREIDVNALGCEAAVRSFAGTEDELEVDEVFVDGQPYVPRTAPALASGAYVRGVRAGRLAGFVWGLLLGAGAVAASFHLGWVVGP